jgi:hypothetical protein
LGSTVRFDVKIGQILDSLQDSILFIEKQKKKKKTKTKTKTKQNKKKQKRKRKEIGYAAT